MLCIHLHATRAGYMALSPPLHIVGYPDVIYLMADSEETVYCDRFFFLLLPNDDDGHHRARRVQQVKNPLLSVIIFRVRKCREHTLVLLLLAGRSESRIGITIDSPLASLFFVTHTGEFPFFLLRCP